MTVYSQASTELHTIRDWLRFAVSQFENSDIFFGHGTDNSLSLIHISLKRLRLKINPYFMRN